MNGNYRPVNGKSIPLNECQYVDLNKVNLETKIDDLRGELELIIDIHSVCDTSEERKVASQKYMKILNEYVSTQNKYRKLYGR